MTVSDLKKALKAKGLSSTGVKQDLIERLQLAMATDEVRIFRFIFTIFFSRQFLFTSTKSFFMER